MSDQPDARTCTGCNEPMPATYRRPYCPECEAAIREDIADGKREDERIARRNRPARRHLTSHE